MAVKFTGGKAAAGDGRHSNTRVNKLRRINKQLGLLRVMERTPGRVGHTRALEAALERWKGES